MHLVVGLGNPGESYAETRHNVAWRVLDELARRWGATRVSRGGTYACWFAGVAGKEVELMQPLTFVNRAGEALAQWRQERGEPHADLLVVSDDVYLPVGMVRLRARGSSGGHRGLSSIEQTLGGREFARLRIGVGPAASSAALREYVLEVFTPEEGPAVREAVGRAADAVECWLADGIAAAMNRFNRRASKEVREP